MPYSKAYAARKNLVLVDDWEVLATPDGAMKADYPGDGVHPTAEGFAAVEPLALAAIARAAR